MGATTGRKIKKVGFFDPYLDTLGGGERYVLTIAEYFSVKVPVTIFWAENIKEITRERLKINVSRVIFLPFKKNVLKRMSTFRQYDLFFYVTDGSLFFSPAKHNVLIIQSPAHLPSDRLIDRIKLSNWKVILCYSRFVADFIKQRLQRLPIVLPPPVDIHAFTPKKKENIIISTGRFFSHLHSKKQDFLVECFIELLQKEKVKNWRFVLIGSVDDGDAKRYLERIKIKAKGYPIEFFTNASFSLIRDYYTRAKIFWLATGFGEDLKKHPERAEHFGIVTVEAMAAEAVPIVFNGGGQPEIVTHGKDGYLFRTKEELTRFTQEILRNEDKRRHIAREAERKSREFSKEVFIRRLDELFQK